MRLRAHTTPVRRTILSIVLLLPFLAGSNRCLIGALGYGGPMKCLSVPAAQADATPGHCCHGPATAGDRADAPAAPERSCCIEAVPVPAGAATDGPAIALTAFVTPATVIETPDDAFVPFERTVGESPPLPPDRPAAPSRAPPRA